MSNVYTPTPKTNALIQKVRESNLPVAEEVIARLTELDLMLAHSNYMMNNALDNIHEGRINNAIADLNAARDTIRYTLGSE